MQFSANYSCLRSALLTALGALVFLGPEQVAAAPEPVLRVRHEDVLPVYLDVLPPGGRMYDVPPGTSKRSWDWSPAISGRVLALGGHLHKYGQKLVLEDVTTGDGKRQLRRRG